MVNVFTAVSDFFNYIGAVVNCYLPNTMGWAFDHVGCAFDKVATLFDCFFYYLLDIFGKILYLPIALIFFFTGMLSVEADIWDSIESVDKTIHDATGLHICHFSDFIQGKCYKCNIRKLKRAPEWPF
jgi:hypothetical protein